MIFRLKYGTFSAVAVITGVCSALVLCGLNPKLVQVLLVSMAAVRSLLRQELI